MKTYRQTSRTATNSRYADPDSFFNTAELKVAVQPKKAGPQTVYNAKSGINMQRTVAVPVPEGCDDCSGRSEEKLALNFSLSGSTQNKAEVRKLVEDFKPLLDAYMNDLTSGFLPDATSVEMVNG